MAHVEAKTSPAETGTGLSLKLLIDSKSNRVMFAEAGKDVIDFLLSLLQMPLGSIIALLAAKNMVGCIGNLYDSVQVIDDDYLQPNMPKETILKPKVVSASLSQNASLLAMGDGPPEPSSKKYYRCYRGVTCAQSVYVTDIYGTVCPRCKYMMTVPMDYVGPPKGGQGIVRVGPNEGYVKELVTYMVMDDLRVMPMSTISGLTLLNNFGVEDIRLLKEKTVVIGVEQGLRLLKASFESKTVLTDVFLVEEKESKLKQFP